MAITWLHISDIHCKSGDTYDSDVVLQSLVESVQKFRDRDVNKPDLVFVTGDMACSGNGQEYVPVTAFLDALINAAGIDKHHLFVVPGNHDVDRNLGIGLARTLDKEKHITPYFAPSFPKHHISQKQRAFVKWYNHYFTGIREFPTDSSCGPVEFVTVHGCKIGILPMNSALFCQDKDDHEKLFIGHRALKLAVSDLKKGRAGLNIALVHHPLEWLSSVERGNIKRTLSEAVNIILSGHLHEQRIESVTGFIDTVVHLTAGAAYETTKYPNRAMYVTMNEGQLTVFPIRYEKDPEEWLRDPSVFPSNPPTHTGHFPLSSLTGSCGGISEISAPLSSVSMTHESLQKPTETTNRPRRTEEDRNDLIYKVSPLVRASNPTLNLLETSIIRKAGVDGISRPRYYNRETWVIKCLLDMGFGEGKSVLLDVYGQLEKKKDSLGVEAIKKASRFLIPWLYVDSIWEEIAAQNVDLRSKSRIVSVGTNAFAEIVMAGLNNRAVAWSPDWHDEQRGEYAQSFNMSLHQTWLVAEERLRRDLLETVKAPSDVINMVADLQKDSNMVADLQKDSIVRRIQWLNKNGFSVYLIFLRSEEDKSKEVQAIAQIMRDYPGLEIVKLEQAKKGANEALLNEIRPLLL